MTAPLPPTSAKPGLHPRNRHGARYDFPALVRACPGLADFVRPNPAGDTTVDFADPAAVTALNRALLKLHYGIAAWEIPPGYLCPPIPGRADYIHHVADLLGVPRGPETVVLDVGIGANAIYPIVGVCDYGWRFVGSDIDATALASAQRIVAANPALAGRIECRRQTTPANIFAGVVRAGETFAASLCNPPFHRSAAEAAAGTQRKLRNLSGRTASAKPVRNFGGRSHELWCPGGEAAFVRRMIAESAAQPGLCRWFTTLVALRENLPPLYRALGEVRPADVRTIDLAHGQKKSRILAWRF